MRFRPVIKGHLEGIGKISPSRIVCNAIVEESPSKSMKGSSSAGLWLLDREMRIVWMNEWMERAYGPLDKVQGKNCFWAFRNRKAMCKHCLPMQAFETGTILTGYVSREDADGVERHYQLIEAPLTDAENRVRNVLEIVLDVTDRARTDRAVRESEAHYRALFDHAGTAVAVNDPSGVLFRVNQAFLDLTGYRRSAIEGKLHYLAFVHPKDRPRIEEFTRRRSRDPRSAPDAYDVSLITKGGQERLVHLWVSQIPGGEQICSILDLTDMRKLEMEVRSKEQFLANILRHSLDAIVALDVRGIICSWNQGAEQMFGYKAKEILGRSFSVLLEREHRSGRKAAEIWKPFETQGFARNLVLTAVSKDGRKMTVDLTRTAIRDPEGHHLGSSVVMRDVTKQRQDEKGMIQQEKMHAMGELAASLAHEIKNPLNSMVINMEVLKARISDLPQARKEQIAKYLEVLATETDRLDKVVRGFLTFTKPIPWTPAEVDVGGVLRHVANLVQPQAARDRIRVRTRIADNLPLVRGSEDQLKQTFLNLLLNAIQAMPRGGHLDIAAARDRPGWLEVKISDTGVGIPRQNFGKIFDLYFSSKEKGSGLGLALVKRLVHAHGGTITFKSRVNHGTTFTVALPTL